MTESSRCPGTSGSSPAGHRSDRLLKVVEANAKRRYPCAGKAARSGNQESIERLRRLAARHDADRRRRPRLRPLRRHRPRAICPDPGQPGGRGGAVGQDPRRLRVVRRQRRAEHHRAVRRPDVLQASADDRHQGKRPAQDRRAVRLAQVDARDEAALRRGQGRDRAGRGLRPAVVLALHVGVVLAHGGPQ